MGSASNCGELIDCLLVRQPYASLIAYGVKRWEFRMQNCRKRGPILIASSRGKPLKTGDRCLNMASNSFPRGFVLAKAVLVDSFPVTNEQLSHEIRSEAIITVHRHEFGVVQAPIGEPLVDVKKTATDEKWRMFAWVVKDVRPLKSIIPLMTNGTGSSWTKISFDRGEVSKNLDSFI